MTEDELTSWNKRRTELFAGAQIPVHALAAILNDTRRMDYARAMTALEDYRARKPYRGFWLADWQKVYDNTKPTAARQTDSGLEAAAAARRAWADEEMKAAADKAREIREYNAISIERRERAAAELRHLGWETNDRSRAWRVLVLMWNRGEDVSQCVHPDRLCQKLPEAVKHTLTRDERIRELQALLTGTQWELQRLMAGGAA